MENNQNNQERLFSQLQNQQQLLRQIEELERLVKSYLSGEAIARYGTLKAGHPEKAMQILALLAQAIHSRQITEKLSDKEFKNILMNLQQPKKEFKLRRK